MLIFVLEAGFSTRCFLFWGTGSLAMVLPFEVMPDWCVGLPAAGLEWCPLGTALQPCDANLAFLIKSM